jgi:PAZ domain
MNIEAGSTCLQLSNHFRFTAKTISGKIHIYLVDYGVFNEENHGDAIRSIDTHLKKVFVKYLTFHKYLFSPTDLSIDELDAAVFLAASHGKEGQIKFTKYDSFSLSEESSQLMTKTTSPAILDFLGKVIKRSLFDSNYTQLGRLPKFFKPEHQTKIEEYQVKMWPGYSCEVKLLNHGLFLNVDTATKFIQLQTVYDLL